MIHRIAHWLGWNGCFIVNRDDGMYLHCKGCGVEKFYMSWRDASSICGWDVKPKSVDEKATQG